MAQLQTLQAGAAREHEEVGQEIAALQAQIDRDRQDLAVYRGVIAPASSGSSLQVQQLRITAGDAANQFVAHLTLMQGGKPDAMVTGAVGVRVIGPAERRRCFCRWHQRRAQGRGQFPLLPGRGLPDRAA